MAFNLVVYFIAYLFSGGEHDGVLLLGEVGQSHVPLALEADVSGEAVRCGLACGLSGDGIDVGNIDLDTGVVLGLDQSVSVAAFSRDVKVNVFSNLVLHGDFGFVVFENCDGTVAGRE